MEEVRKLCTTCRKYAKAERVLFHYNGHGVPKPTSNGEIWLFNKVSFLSLIFPCLLVLIVFFFLTTGVNHMLQIPLCDGVMLLQSYTQYIPLPISDLDSWLRTPSIYVFDCSAAGIIVNNFIEVFRAV